MHELSIVVGLVEFAEGQAAASGWSRISGVHLRIGPLSGVVPEALEFAFDVATNDTVLAGAELVIERVPVVIFCEKCGGERAARSEYDLACGDCGEPSADVRGGREMEVTAFEVHSNGTPS